MDRNIFAENRISRCLCYADVYHELIKSEYAENFSSLNDEDLSFCHMSVCTSLNKHTLEPKAYPYEELIRLEKEQKPGDQ